MTPDDKTFERMLSFMHKVDLNEGKDWANHWLSEVIDQLDIDEEMNLSEFVTSCLFSLEERGYLIVLDHENLSE